MAVIRFIIGRFILFFDFVFSPKKPKLSAERKEELANKTASFSLYQLPACPFCVKVRRAMKRQGIDIELRNINKSEAHRSELIEQGGKRTVPCLRIEETGQDVKWMYESKDIINYLSKL